MNETEYRSSAGMASAAMILGIFSLIMMATGFSIITGSIGVILALLSRGSGTLSGRSLAGFITSFLGILGGIGVLIFTYVTLFSGDPQQAMDRLNTLYETYIEQGSIDAGDIDQVISDDEEQTDVSSDQVALSVILEDGEVIYL